MRTYQVVATAATALSAAGLSARAVPPAQAASPVVVYSRGMAGNWQCPAVLPGEVGYGALWDIASMHWTHWTGGSAYGAGVYWLGRDAGYRADIALTGVEHLRGAAVLQECPHHRTRTPLGAPVVRQ